MDKKLSLVFSIFLIVIVYFSTLTYAVDSNGIWHFASDVRGGTFGSDEDFVGDFVFVNDVLLQDSSLVVNTDSGRGIFSSSSIDDGIAGKSSILGKSGIYGWGINGAYSGYFEGGDFIVDAGNVGIGTKTPVSELDVNGSIIVKNNVSTNLINTNAIDSSGIIDVQAPLNASAGLMVEVRDLNPSVAELYVGRIWILN